LSGRARHFLRDSVRLQAGAVFVALAHVASSVILARQLGSTEQGLWYGALTLFGFLYLLGSLGFATTAISGVAAAGSREGVTRWLGWLARTWVALAVGVLLAGLVLVRPAAEYVFDERAVGFPALMLCATPLLEVPRTIARAALEGTRRMLSATLLDGGLELLRAAAVCTAVVVEPTLMSAVWGHLLGVALGVPWAVGLYARARRTGADLPASRTLFAAARRARVRDHARGGVELGIGRLARGFVSEQAPILLLMRFAEPAWIAYFRIAHRLLSLPFLATQSVARVSVPAFGELVRAADWRGLASTYWRVTAWTGGLRCAAFAVWIPLVPLVTRRLYPPGYADAIWTLALVFGPGLAALTFSAAVEAFYVATGTIRSSLRINTALGLGTVALLVALSASFGALGTAWALTIGAVASLYHHARIAAELRRRCG